jgi:hypothetical protein
MLDVRVGKREFAVFVLRLSENNHRISLRKPLCQIPPIEPNRLRVVAVRIDENGFDEEFFVAREFGREEFDGALDRLFFPEVDIRKSRREVALVLDVARKIEKQIFHAFHSRARELFDIRIGRMQKGFRELHTGEYTGKGGIVKNIFLPQGNPG